ncbi:hypothetical protein HDG34_001163 [Paraburkholderia sp. HC6.4b]|uniref:hypothetical protein n=1 Tax=unclassified Paraburkholderia TaxID=2615204 RepID=UPI00184A51BA|nr:MULTISPECIES: hypothetical protein [unclassified Paraburkholderia]MBB5407240.1 hypothetical protein [Paraburkholderia sp. HC6.4b]MBB5449637.1 hypothetical protein [Paraburkholderia sp. Kb1A]
MQLLARGTFSVSERNRAGHILVLALNAVSYGYGGIRVTRQNKRHDGALFAGMVTLAQQVVDEGLPVGNPRIEDSNNHAAPVFAPYFASCHTCSVSSCICNSTSSISSSGS